MGGKGLVTTLEGLRMRGWCDKDMKWNVFGEPIEEEDSSDLVLILYSLHSI